MQDGIARPRGGRGVGVPLGWAVVAVGMIAGCGTSAGPAPVAGPSSSYVAPLPTPPYQLREDRDGWATVYVVDQLSDDELSRVFRDARLRIIDGDAEGGWFVSVNCGSYDGPRLGNGKFAIDDLGAAQTGLAAPGRVEFEALPNRQPC